jgi:hypothetical protein
MFSPAASSLDHAGWRHEVREPGASGYGQPEMPEPKVQRKLRRRPRGSGWADRHRCRKRPFTEDRHGLRPGTPLDPYLQLFDTSGNVLAEDDDGEIAANNNTINPNADGDYTRRPIGTRTPQQTLLCTRFEGAPTTSAP